VAIDRDGTLRKAEKFLRQGRLDQAIAEYHRIIEDQPEDWSTINAVGDLLVRAGQTESGIEHFTRIADAVSLPVYLYNIPGRTGNTIAPETAAKLAPHENIVGIKDSAGDWASISAFLDATRDTAGFDVLTGPDHLAHDGFLAGSAACISGLANVAPEWVSRIWTRFRDGDIAGSRAAQDVISALRKDLYAVAFAPAAVKKAAALLGERVGDSRYATLFSAGDVATIERILEKYRLGRYAPAAVA